MSSIEPPKTAGAQAFAAASFRETTIRGSADAPRFSLPEILNPAPSRQATRPAATLARPLVRALPPRPEPTRNRSERAEREPSPRDKRVADSGADRNRPTATRPSSEPRRAAETPTRDTAAATAPRDDEPAAAKPGTGDIAAKAAPAGAETGIGGASAGKAADADDAAAALAGTGQSEEAVETAPTIDVGALTLVLPIAGEAAQAVQGAKVASSHTGGGGSGLMVEAGRTGRKGGEVLADTKEEVLAGKPSAASVGSGEGRVPAHAVHGIAGRSSEGEGGRDTASEQDLLTLATPADAEGSPASPTVAKHSFADLLGQTGAADPKGAATVHRTVVTDVAVARVPIEIGLRSLDGTNQFEIRLTPEELGRVDVKLDISEGGSVKAHLIVERPEALALLTRDRSQLEQALEQAGLKPADGGIAFSLRDGSAENGGRFTQDGGGRERPPVPSGLEEPAQGGGTPLATPRAILSRLGALDLRI